MVCVTCCFTVFRNILDRQMSGYVIIDVLSFVEDFDPGGLIIKMSQIDPCNKPTGHTVVTLVIHHYLPTSR